MNQSASRNVAKKPQEKRVNHQARFVKESFGDRFQVQAGQQFVKTWTFRNSGESEWPEDTIFTQTNGDDLNAKPFKIQDPVLPNQEIDVTLTLQAPQMPGNYNAFFRFVCSDNSRFGQKVWCDILVVSQSPVKIPQSSLEVERERSSLLNDESIIIEQPAIQEPFFKFEDVIEEPAKEEA